MSEREKKDGRIIRRAARVLREGIGYLGEGVAGLGEGMSEMFTFGETPIRRHHLGTDQDAFRNDWGALGEDFKRIRDDLRRVMERQARGDQGEDPGNTTKKRGRRL